MGEQRDAGFSPCLRGAEQIAKLAGFAVLGGTLYDVDRHGRRVYLPVGDLVRPVLSAKERAADLL